MKIELKHVEKGIRDLASEIENKISWGDTDVSDTIFALREYADQLKLLHDTAIDIEDLQAVADYQRKGQEMIENTINKMIEDNK